MISLGAQIKKLVGMVDTKDLNAKDNAFVKSIVRQTNDGQDTARLTAPQVEWIEDLHARHFGQTSMPRRGRTRSYCNSSSPKK